MSKTKKTAQEPTKDEAAQAPPDMPTPDQLKVKDTKQYGITQMQKEILGNFLNIQNLNQFQLRAYLQVLAESAWGIKADQFVRFGLDLDKNQITVDFLEPLKSGETPPAQGGLEAAPPAPTPKK